MGEPYLKQKILLSKITLVFSSNYSLYGDLSRRVMRTLKRFNEAIEVYSIDEVFIDLSNFPDSEVEKVEEKLDKQFYNGLVFQLALVLKLKL